MAGNALLDPHFPVSLEFLEGVCARCEKDTGIRFWVSSLQVKRFQDEEKGYTCKIAFWGPNHQRNQAPPAKEKWMTKIEIDITYSEAILTPVNHLPIQHDYSDSLLMDGLAIPVYSGIAHHLPQGQLPVFEEVWRYLGDRLFPVFLKSGTWR